MSEKMGPDESQPQTLEEANAEITRLKAELVARQCVQCSGRVHTGRPVLSTSATHRNTVGVDSTSRHTASYGGMVALAIESRHLIIHALLQSMRSGRN